MKQLMMEHVARMSSSEENMTDSGMMSPWQKYKNNSTINKVNGISQKSKQILHSQKG